MNGRVKGLHSTIEYFRVAGHVSDIDDIDSILTKKMPSRDTRCFMTWDESDAVRMFIVLYITYSVFIVGVVFARRAVMSLLKNQGLVTEYEPFEEWTHRLIIGAILLGGIAIPQMLNFDAMKFFLLVQMFAVCAASAFWFVTKQPSEEDLEDWAVAGKVCRSENENDNDNAIDNGGDNEHEHDK